MSTLVRIIFIYMTNQINTLMMFAFSHTSLKLFTTGTELVKLVHFKRNELEADIVREIDFRDELRRPNTFLSVS